MPVANAVLTSNRHPMGSRASPPWGIVRNLLKDSYHENRQFGRDGIDGSEFRH
jgi:hypothetical protein